MLFSPLTAWALVNNSTLFRAPLASQIRRHESHESSFVSKAATTSTSEKLFVIFVTSAVGVTAAILPPRQPSARVAES